MKNIYAYLLMAALLIGGSSCTKLDEQIPDRFTKKFTPSNPGVGIKNNTNKGQPTDGLAGAFAKVLNGTAASGGYFATQELGTDEAVITQKGGDWYDGGNYIVHHHHAYTPTLWSIDDTWKDAYGGVFQCNTLLATTDPAPLSAAQKAQLRTLRAYFYWRLMDVFGNIKLVTTAGTDVDQADTQTLPLRPVAYAFIESELLAAIPDLPPTRQDYGRVSQGAAYALLARLYLNAKIYTGTQQYAKAIVAADAVINSGVYELSGTGNGGSFAKVFAPDNVDNIEHIFVAPYDEATGTGAQWSQMTLHYPSQLTYKLKSQPWNGWSTLEAFYNSFDPADERRDANFIHGPQFDYFGSPILDLAFDPADPDGAPIDYTPFVNELAPNGSRQGGARFGKFSIKIGQSPDADNDFPLLRYGEVLLNKAEASARLGGVFNNADVTMLTLVNQIRARAGLGTPLGSMTEGEMLAERGRELFSEALRRTDLIRFGAYGNAWWEKTAESAGEIATHTIMPIPKQQIDASLSGKKLVQNPGY